MTTGIVIIGGIGSKGATERFLAEDNYVIQALPANGTDEPPYMRRMPGRARSGEYFSGQHICREDAEGVAIDAITVVEQVAGRGVPRKCLHQLRRGPLCSWMVGHVEVNDASAFVSQCEEQMQDPETLGRHYEEVDRYELLHIVFQERPPRLGWRLARLDHVLGDGCLGHLNSALEQFRVQAGCSPKHVCRTHVSNQVSGFLRHPGPS